MFGNYQNGKNIMNENCAHLNLQLNIIQLESWSGSQNETLVKHVMTKPFHWKLLKAMSGNWRCSCQHSMLITKGFRQHCLQAVWRMASCLLRWHAKGADLGSNLWMFMLGCRFWLVNKLGHVLDNAYEVFGIPCNQIGKKGRWQWFKSVSCDHGTCD